MWRNFKQNRLFSFSTPSAFPLEGVKVDATGKEKIVYLIFSLGVSSSSSSEFLLV
jgi:hypothetical protein